MYGLIALETKNNALWLTCVLKINQDGVDCRQSITAFQLSGSKTIYTIISLVMQDRRLKNYMVCLLIVFSLTPPPPPEIRPNLAGQRKVDYFSEKNVYGCNFSSSFQFIIEKLFYKPLKLVDLVPSTCGIEAQCSIPVRFNAFIGDS